MTVWYESDNPNGFVTGKRFSIDKPCVTVMAAGMGGDSLGHWHIVNDGQPMIATATNKPPYRVPLMSEIVNLPWNGFKAISTFSGCGGSSLGYRMVGFRVLWASEFIDAARESYNANKADYTILDGRDIRHVQPADILDAIKMRPGELDLMDGSPPCASFSTAGKREAGWGKVKKYSDKAQRTDDLFFEFTRLLRGIQPKTFVAENVSGLVKGTAKGYFLEILRDLKASGYRVACKVLDAQWLGVPQQRQRTIFVGVREDLGIDPVHPKPLAYRYSVRDALPWIVKVRKGGGFGSEEFVGADTVGADTVGASPTSGNNFNNNVGAVEARVIHDTGGQFSNGDVTDVPACTVDTNPRFYVESSKTERRKFTIQELKRICAFPDDFVLLGTYAQQWERLGRAVPPVMMSHVAAAVRDGILARIK